MATRQDPAESRTTISRDIVDYLQTEEELSLKEIGDEMGLSKSFVSRVRQGSRNFTLEDLRRLEIARGEPLPVLLAKAINIDSVPHELRGKYKILESVLRVLSAEGEKLISMTQGTSPSVAKRRKTNG